MELNANLLNKMLAGDVRALSRAISFVENAVPGYDELLRSLPASDKKIIGITGPPGAGKSTIVDALIGQLLLEQKTVAILCVDPSSPFHAGALLGDRVRMSSWYNEPGVYIRSLATRGSLGGLHPRIIEISDVVKAASYDYIIIETVGVGQSEIEIAGLADTTVVTVVPEAGDDIQTMKAGLMEIADIFVVNKSDRPGADAFVKNLRAMIPPEIHHRSAASIVKTVATSKKGIPELLHEIRNQQKTEMSIQRKASLLADKAFYILQQLRMSDIDRNLLRQEILTRMSKDNFNLYRFLQIFG